MIEDKNQARTSLSELGEFGLINHLTKNFNIQHKSTIEGVGDDDAHDHGTDELCRLIQVGGKGMSAFGTLFFAQFY